MPHRPNHRGRQYRRNYSHGGSHNNNGNGRMNNSCPPGMHMMPDGTCMEGAYHGASSSGGGYRRGGRTRRRMRHGGHTHNVSAHHMSEAAKLATFHYHGDAGAPFPTYIGNMGHDMYEQMNLPQYQSNYNIPESSHHHDRHGRPGISTTQMRRGGRPTRRMEHGGSHCGPGMMYQNGGCVSYEHGGHHQVLNSDSDRQRRKR